MGTSGSPSWLLLQELMLHIGKTRKEDFREKGVVVRRIVCVVHRVNSACIQIEALHDLVSRLSAFGSVAEFLHAALMKHSRLSSS